MKKISSLLNPKFALESLKSFLLETGRSYGFFPPLTTFPWSRFRISRFLFYPVDAKMKVIHNKLTNWQTYHKHTIEDTYAQITNVLYGLSFQESSIIQPCSWFMHTVPYLGIYFFMKVAVVDVVITVMSSRKFQWSRYYLFHFIYYFFCWLLRIFFVTLSLFQLSPLCTFLILDYSLENLIGINGGFLV